MERRVVVESGESMNPSATDTPTSAARPSGGDADPVRVLIVEDRPVARKLLADELSQAQDLEVSRIARDGEEAVQIVREGAVDVVIMDLVMPSKDGIQTISEIRGFSSIPIILLTGASIATESIEHVARRKGADAFIRKPSGPVSVDLYRITDKLVGEIRRLARPQTTDNMPPIDRQKAS